MQRDFPRKAPSDFRVIFTHTADKPEEIASSRKTFGESEKILIVRGVPTRNGFATSMTALALMRLADFIYTSSTEEKHFTRQKWMQLKELVILSHNQSDASLRWI